MGRSSTVGRTSLVVTTALLAMIGFAGVVCLAVGLIGGFFAGYYTPRDWDRPRAFDGDTGNSPLIPAQFQALVIAVLGLLLGAALAAVALLGFDALF